jgi:hypothetical protein
MAMRYTLTQGIDPRSTLVVDTCARIDDQAIEALRRFMHGYGCETRHGDLTPRQRDRVYS